MSLVYIVIPTYNEAENLPKLVEKIFLLPLNIEVLVVDDNSPDNTGKIAGDLSKKYKLEVLHRSGKMGLGSAYIAGFRKALDKNADFIMEIDADLSHDPADIPKLVQALETGADLAIGSRRIAGGRIVGWNWWRKFMSWGAMTFARLFLGLKTKDVTAGFRCYRRQILAEIQFAKIKSNGYSFQEETLFWVEKLGAKVAEVPVVFHDRQQGKSKLSKKDIWDFFMVMFKLKWKNVTGNIKKLD